MEKFLVLALIAVICAVVKSDEEMCIDNIFRVCSDAYSFPWEFEICEAQYGGIDHIEPELQAYINSQLAKSYEYLLMSTHFNSYQKNRPGFEKLYKQLSDRSFNNAIDLTKELTRRGGRVNLNTRLQNPASINMQHLNYKVPASVNLVLVTDEVQLANETTNGYQLSRRHSIAKDSLSYEQRYFKLELDELQSLGLALDNEKQLAEGAMHVHARALHDKAREPEIAHYIEEKFLVSQAETIYKLSGYVKELSEMVKNPHPSLAINLFDEYLEKL